MPDYPIVKIPQRILQINKSVPSVMPEPIAPIKPVEPNIPEAPRLLEVEETFVSSGCLGSLLIWAIGLTIAVIGANPVTTVIGGVCIIFALFRPRNVDSKKAAKSNSEQQKKYEKLIVNYKAEKQAFDSVNLQYSVDLQKYKDDKCTYDLSLKEKSNNDDYEWSVYEFRKKLLSKALSESAEPIPYNGNQYRAGVTEDLFFDKLNGFFCKQDFYAPFGKGKDGFPIIPKGDFSVKILRNYILPNNNLERPFMPDFILSIESTKQSVVIEIDEPYVGSDGTPIHCIGSKDDYRDRHFLANGWIVIRLAEEQIIKQSFECCWFIADTLLRHTPSFEVGSIQNDMMSYWDEISLNKVPQWTKEESNKMGFARYRHEYLPSQLAAKIQEEKYVAPISIDGEPRTVFNKEEREKRDEKNRQLFKIDEDDDNDLPF